MSSTGIEALSDLLHETSERHGSFEAVARYMAEVKHVVVSPP
jgi:hypothetical protein